MMKKYWSSLVRVSSCYAVLTSCAAEAAFAQDLLRGVDEAGTNFLGFVKKALQIISVAVIVVGLGHAAFRASQKDPGFIWSLLGVVGGGVLFAIASGMLQ